MSRFVLFRFIIFFFLLFSFCMSAQTQKVREDFPDSSGMVFDMIVTPQDEIILVTGNNTWLGSPGWDQFYPRLYKYDKEGLAFNKQLTFKAAGVVSLNLDGDNNMLVLSYIRNDWFSNYRSYRLCKYNPDGEFISSAETNASCILLSKDKNYVFLSRLSSGFYITKQSTAGDTLWSRKIMINSDYPDLYIKATDDGGYIAAGQFTNGSSKSDIFLVKFNSEGDSLWSKTFGGDDYEFLNDLNYRAGKIVLTGTTDAYGSGKEDFYFIETDDNGTSVVEKTISDTLSGRGYTAAILDNGNYIFTGESYVRSNWYKAYIGILDKNLNELWSNVSWRYINYGPDIHANNTGMVPNKVVLTERGFFVAGYTWAQLYGPWAYNAFVFRYSSDLITDVDDAPEQNLSFDLSQNYPNPFNPVTTIRSSIAEGGFVSLKVFDLLGREVTTLVNKEMSAGEYSAEFDAGEVSSGVYLYKLRVGNNVLSRKMMVVK